MDEVLNVSNIMDGASGNAKMILEEFGQGQQAAGVLITAAIVGVLLCLFGFKLIRVLTALTGFFLGAAVGTIICGVAQLTGMTVVIVIFACAVVLALLSFFLYRVGIFFFVLQMVVGAAFSFIDPASTVQLLIALGAGIVAAVLAVIFIEPVVIILTSISGGIWAGTAITQLTGLDGNPVIGLGISIILAVVGMIVQFMMQSRKVGRKEKIHSEKVKEKVSMESEVEKARMILDDDDMDSSDADGADDTDDIEIIDNFDDIEDKE